MKKHNEESKNVNKCSKSKQEHGSYHVHVYGSWLGCLHEKSCKKYMMITSQVT
jgi:hypothetical protein